MPPGAASVLRGRPRSASRAPALGRGRDAKASAPAAPRRSREPPPAPPRQPRRAGAWARTQRARARAPCVRIRPPDASGRGRQPPHRRRSRRGARRRSYACCSRPAGEASGEASIQRRVHLRLLGIVRPVLGRVRGGRVSGFPGACPGHSGATAPVSHRVPRTATLTRRCYRVGSERRASAANTTAPARSIASISSSMVRPPAHVLACSTSRSSMPWG